ncbi:MAG: DUF2520 domain-containing protein [Gemmatimonadota bacterium]|nr:DUF2520 domain-containing protein [Gemmatimonadota bacterium]
MSERIFVIGAGTVGGGLAHAFRSAGLQLVGVHARSPGDGATTSGALPRVIGDANVVLLAVSDSSLGDVCSELALAASGRHPQLAHGTVVLYTSGSVTPTQLGELRTVGCACGTFHPMMPLAVAEHGAAMLRDGWVGIDGDAMACATARRLAAAIGARTVNIPAGAKPQYHAAAVITSNFPIVLATLAARLLTGIGVDARAAEQLTQRLMLGAVENLRHGSAADLLTTAMARDDAEVIAADRAALARDADLLAVYDALTRASRSLPRGHTGRVDDPDVGRRGELKG